MKKVLSLVLALLMSVSCLAITANAAGSSFSAATSISMGTTYSDTITSTATEDYYKFTISTSGMVNLNLQAEFEYLMIYLYDSNKTQVWANTFVKANSSGEISYSKELELTSGTYYFVVKRYNSYDYSMGSYKFKMSFTSASESFKETGWGSNNKIDNANSISLNTTYYGQIAINDEFDYYKFTLSSSGSVTLDFKSDIEYTGLYIYNSSKAEVWKNSYVTANSSGEISYSTKISLSAGTYYLRVTRYNTYDYSMGKYSVKLSSSSTSGSSVSLSLSSSSVSVKAGNSTKVTCSYSGSNSNGITITYSVGDKSVATCEWGSWSNKSIPLTIKGVAAGSTTVTVKLKDSKTEAVLATKTISVSVTSASSGSVSLSLSTSSVSVKVGNTTKVNCSYSGSNPNGLTISYKIADSNIVSCSWGGWSGNTDPLTIKGLSAGSTTVTVSLKDSKTGDVLATKTISVKVTAADSGSSGGNNSGNTGNSGGESIFITIIMFPIRAIMWFFGLFF